ncbi:DUF6283 family protein [Nocardiopsis synnemataformans]|uniref:DUF6283 family protein n=1 Tax=Nocardiopsis synnemataformans TaxID=61305 RepID=UPI003EBA11BA
MTARTPAKVQGAHLCSDDYRVLSMEADNHSRRKICGDCPWRRDTEAGAFPVEAFRRSARTAYNMSERLFGCHTSGKEHVQTCVGFLLRGAEHNLAVRLNPVDPDTLDTGGAELYNSYREMAIANGVDPNDPVLAPCRDA